MFTHVETPPNKGIAKAKKARKREEAQRCQAAFKERTPEQHLQVLIDRGYGDSPEANAYREFFGLV